MPTRILNLDKRNQRKAQKVLNHAKKRVNWYNPSVPGWMSNIPGHDRNHRCELNDYRCVFSYTIDTPNDRVVRHLSISVPSKGYPHPVTIKQIAPLFGFTDSDGAHDAKMPASWIIHVKKKDPIDDHCIVIGQDTGIKP